MVKDDVPVRLLATYAPGTNPQVFAPGTALRLEPGGVLELQMHYTSAGQDETDRTRIGMIFSKDPAPREVRAGQFFNTTLRLPAGAANVAVDADLEFVQDATVWGLFPHTHVRGKKWEYVLQLPDGSKKKILSVPAIRLQLADVLHVQGAVADPKGRKDPLNSVVRQLARQSSEPRSVRRRKVGRSDVGGNAVHRHSRIHR